jgi:hypothetical protein
LTVFYDPKSNGWRYDFRYLKRRYTASRGFPTKREAKDAEAERRRLLRRRAVGLEVGGGTDSPRFAAWAEVYIDFLEQHERVTAPESVEHTLRVVLRFWGASPDRPLKPHEEGPYHDLRLLDPIGNPALILKFEE